jgi:pyruvate,orthophosphate dikinase
VSAVGKDKLKDVLGYKGANLAELTTAGAPVPKGLVITNEFSLSYFKSNPPAISDELWAPIVEAVQKLEADSQKKFGGAEQPFFVAVRNSPGVSFQKALLSFFHVGFNDQSTAAFAQATEDPKFAWLTYLRFMQTYALNVLKIEADRLQEVINVTKAEKGVQQESDLEAEDLEGLCVVVKNAIETFPQDPLDQLKGAIEYVLQSWTSEAAVEFRKANSIAEESGFAIVVMTMVFGNFGPMSASGVYYTRNPNSGERVMPGSFALTATGSEFLAKTKPSQPMSALEAQIPAGYEKINEANKSIEKYFKDIQKVDFTIENSQPFVLQARTSRRSAAAGIKLAVEFVNEGVMQKDEAIKQLLLSEAEALLNPVFRPEDVQMFRDRRFFQGQTTGPGAIVGPIVLSREKAIEVPDTILFIDPANPPDYVGLMTVTAFVIKGTGPTVNDIVALARRRGIVAIWGSDFTIDAEQHIITSGPRSAREGEVISIDGQNGDVFLAQIPLTKVELEERTDLQNLLAWADEIRHAKECRPGPAPGLQIFATIDSPEQIPEAKAAGADGFGLVKTDHILLGERIPIVQRIVFPTTQEDREAAFRELEEAMTQEVASLFEAMSGFSSVIQLADPPLSQVAPDLLEQTELVEVLKIRLEVAIQKEEAEKAEAAAKAEAEAAAKAEAEAAAKAQEAAEPPEGATEEEAEKPPEGESPAEPAEPPEKVPTDREVKEAELNGQIRRLEAVTQFYVENPQLGVRGVRLSLAVPGFLRMQFRAIIEAVYASLDRGGRPDVQILIPFVTGPEEVQKVRLDLKAMITASQKTHENPIGVHLGAEIAVPRAALATERLAVQTEFLSVNADDLTAIAFGWSAHQADAQFLTLYRDWAIFASSPFQALDQDGVGELIKIAADAAISANPDITIGAVGQQTGDPASVAFFSDIGLSYVSCAPAKIPIVKLAAAQAVIKDKEEEIEEQPEVQEEQQPPEETDSTQEDD